MHLRRIWNRMTAPFQLIYWQLTLPEAEGVKLLIECNDKFLMIRETYGPKHWTFPGGRMRRYELPEDAAIRKAQEEVGITLYTPAYLGSYFHTRQYKRDAICVYHSCVTTTEHHPDTSIVVESGWFAREDMETLVSSDSVDDAMELYGRHTGQ
jgi:ADP-ribose pyrophosphatase YjhB (NUDIX family)